MNQYRKRLRIKSLETQISVLNRELFALHREKIRLERSLWPKEYRDAYRIYAAEHDRAAAILRELNERLSEEEARSFALYGDPQDLRKCLRPLAREYNEVRRNAAALESKLGPKPTLEDLPPLQVVKG